MRGDLGILNDFRNQLPGLDIYCEPDDRWGLILIAEVCKDGQRYVLAEPMSLLRDAHDWAIRNFRYGFERLEKEHAHA